MFKKNFIAEVREIKDIINNIAKNNIYDDIAKVHNFTFCDKNSAFKDEDFCNYIRYYCSTKNYKVNFNYISRKNVEIELIFIKKEASVASFLKYN